MSKNNIEDLLNRYAKGEASPEEIEQVETWLNNTGNTNSEWEHMDKSGKDKWLSDLFSEIETTINQPKVVVMHPRKTLWRSVAAVAAILVISFIGYLEWPVIQSNLHPVQLSSLSVPANQKKQITLPDGSQVWVNAESKLKYPKVFTGKTREVYLSGEAYFDVKHDATKPFIIHTGKVITTVLGTAFNIKEDKNLHTIVVTVTRGKVSVANGNQPLGIITPNQQISFNIVNEDHFQKDIDAKLVIAWQESDIRFDDITFVDAAAQLQQRFKVKITFGNDKIKNCRFSGTAIKGEKLDKILEVICAFNNATYETKGDGSIMIDGAGCN